MDQLIGILIEVHVFNSNLGRWLMRVSVKEGSAEERTAFFHVLHHFTTSVRIRE